MKENVCYGLLLDVDSRRLELYQDKHFMASINLPRECESFYPAFYVKTILDRIRIRQVPSLPDDNELLVSSKLKLLQMYLRIHETGGRMTWQDLTTSAQELGWLNDNHIGISAMPRSSENRTSAATPLLKLDTTQHSERILIVNDFTLSAAKNNEEGLGGYAIADRGFCRGINYWEVVIESMLDAERSDGSVRLGLAFRQDESHEFDMVCM